MRTHLLTVIVVFATLTAVACSSSPTSPSGGAIASVAIAGTTVAAGSTVQGTVTLASAAGGSGATVALSSSNPAALAVPGSITIASGATSGSFAVTGVAPGSATITATMNGSSRQSPTLTVSAGLQLASITVSPTTVVGGSNVTATVTLTGPAPPGGITVALSSDGTAVVPASVTVKPADTSATFMVLTQVVSGPTTATINGSYGGSSKTATISLTRTTVATANFGVTGRQVTETCAVINDGTALDCTFDASTSNAPGTITAYDWTWSVSATTAKTQTTSGPVFASPSFSCSMLPPPSMPATGSLTLTVTLTIHDDAGNVSTAATDSGVRLLPQGSCGY